MKIRVRFEKDGVLRYIGHLDVMRFFHKAFQRAEIDVKFSEGFHPHPIMSFASPLSVGLTSRGEYLDTELVQSESSRAMIDCLNGVMVPGIRVTGFRLLPESERRKDNNAMALVGLADYRVSLLRVPAPGPDWGALVEEFLSRQEIRILRKTKHREEETNIRPWIRSFRYEKESDSFFLRLSAGSMANLKPETVMEAFLRDLVPEAAACLQEEGEPVPRDLWLSVCRLDLLTAEGISLGELGEEIP